MFSDPCQTPQSIRIISGKTVFKIEKWISLLPNLSDTSMFDLEHYESESKYKNSQSSRCILYLITAI